MSTPDAWPVSWDVALEVGLPAYQPVTHAVDLHLGPQWSTQREPDRRATTCGLGTDGMIYPLVMQAHEVTCPDCLANIAAFKLRHDGDAPRYMGA